jgi:hypothetical protein
MIFPLRGTALIDLDDMTSKRAAACLLAALRQAQLSNEKETRGPNSIYQESVVSSVFVT